MDSLYMKGELLQVHTKDSEVIEGRFYGMNSDNSRISLYDIKEDQKGVADGLSHYYNSEIRNIVKVKETENPRHLKISQQDCENIIKVSKKYIYINQMDNSYHEALDDLNNYSYVGLSTDGSNRGRNCKMPFLVMSTPQQIYIFDIQVMQYHCFDGGLKSILESETPKKIVHDSRKLSDCLYHRHQVKLNSVFDTQVGDLIITKNKNGCLPHRVKSLSECLTSYLGLPENVIEEQLDMAHYSERPLSVKKKEILAKNIAYLHRLSEVINDEMSLPFVRGVEYFIKNLRSSDEYKAWQIYGKYNQLPKEFKSVIEY